MFENWYNSSIHTLIFSKATKALEEINTSIHSRLARSTHWDRVGPKQIVEPCDEEQVSAEDVQGLLQKLQKTLYKPARRIEKVDSDSDPLDQGMYFFRRNLITRYS